MFNLSLHYEVNVILRISDGKAS